MTTTEGTETTRTAIKAELAEQLKLAYDRSVAALGEQRADLTALQGRAKDFMGFATLAAGIGKLVASEPYLTFDSWTAYVVIGAVAVLVLVALYVLSPRTQWKWGMDPSQMRDHIVQPNFASMSDVYDYGLQNMATYEAANRDNIRKRKWATWMIMVAFAVESFSLVYAAVASAQVTAASGGSCAPGTSLPAAATTAASGSCACATSATTIVTVPGTVPVNNGMTSTCRLRTRPQAASRLAPQEDR